jgi:D-alanyl-D-alanine carboxypeptidase (penicillin-binding protein 5/6)
MNISTKHHLLAFGYVVILVGIIGFSRNVSDAMPPEGPKPVPPHTISEQNIRITGKAAVLYDVTERRFIYTKNADTQLPIASLTKLATILTAADKAGTSTDKQIQITAANLREDGDTGLLANEHWSLSSLMNFTLVSSSNDGAAAIANAFGAEDSFVEAMNTKVRLLGLSQTYFLNPTGLDLSESTSGGYSSAHDIALLLSYLISEKPELIEKTALSKISVTSESGITHTVSNTDKIIDIVPGIFASKTGFTDLAGGNLAVAFDAGPARPMIAVVLSSTESGRFTDTQTLMNATLSYMRGEL